MKKTLIVTGISLAAFVLFFAIVMLSGFSEGYCFFYPSIDTVYASGYSERDFKKITNGMSRSAVDTLMCTPLGVGTNRDGTVDYAYTNDGKCKWGDFAWLGRSLTFSNNHVVVITSRVYMD